jgi:predicted TIM-barrel fold metal-dependent hydrolase
MNAYPAGTSAPSQRSLSRRQWLIQSGATVPLFSLSLQHAWGANRIADDAPWIDAHVHVWPRFGSTYPLADGFTEKDVTPSSFTPEELLQQCRPAGVGRVVLIQMNFFGFDNTYMLECIRRAQTTFRGVAVIDHEQPHVEERMQRLREQGVRGYRLYASAANVAKWKTSEGIQSMFRCGAETKQAMCLLSDPDALPGIDAMLRQHPDTPVVIDHFSRLGMKGEVGPAELDLLCRMAGRKNLSIKTSAFYALGAKRPPYDDLAPMIRRLRDAYGADRLMWASDCPYQIELPHSYSSSIALVRDRLEFLDRREREQILSGTAERIFFSE